MLTLTEDAPQESLLKRSSTSVEEAFAGFLRTVAAAPESVLLMDFDGTLAPFRIDPMSARPWAGVTDILERIEDRGRTRIALISGRPAREVAALLGLYPQPEIWGLHGAERLHRNGELEKRELSNPELAALTAARDAIGGLQAEDPGLRSELKSNAVAVHWRGKSPRARQAAEQKAFEVLVPFAEGYPLTLLRFDGGLELRGGPDKGDAVRELLLEIGPDSPVAFLGDDLTDEFGFLALAGRGAGILVRRTRRPSAATYWLHPPGELRAFLKAWLRAVSS